MLINNFQGSRWAWVHGAKQNVLHGFGFLGEHMQARVLVKMYGMQGKNVRIRKRIVEN